MPARRANYPPDWEQLSLYVRFIRAQGACEQCGAWNGYRQPETGARVMLTVSHTDHDTENNDLSNLRALCQACHLRHDAKLHAQHARQTRQARQAHAGQLAMII
ncbi:MAG TPA: hypothetical protein VMX14_13290 [Anaerolineae bacterium]|nr:hypothetical protein [Anaerolineae bacterium]